jgi:hypothetical protein
MAAKKRGGARESTYLTAEDATELWASLRDETRFTRRAVKGPDTGDEYNQRLLYLMAAAVFRTVERLVPRRRWRKLLDIVEAYADGEATSDQLFDAYEAAGVDTSELPAAKAAAAECIHMLPDDYKVLEGVDYVTDAAGYRAAVAAGVLEKDAGLDEARAVWDEPAFRDAKRAHERALCGLIRDIFGNPYRPVAVDPGWLSPTAVSLARGIYAEKAFDRLPVLADALLEAGCSDEQLLGHCHGPGPHVRGCWVVDLVLGKE